MNIRDLEYNDYENYLNLINQFRPTDFSREMFINILNKIKKSSNIFVLEDKTTNTLVGTGTIIYEIKFIHNICKLAHIEDICIDSRYRNCGYGKLLLNYMIFEAKKQKCYKVVLYCEDHLEKFYNNVGFEKKGIMMTKYFNN